MPEPIVFASSESEQHALDRAAAELGVDLEFYDIWGNLHRVDPDALRAILSSLGIDCATRESIDKSLEARLWDEWANPLPPVIVLSRSDATISIKIPADMAEERARFEFRWEGGSTEQPEVSLGDLPVTGTAELRGKKFVRKAWTLPPSTPLGYHEMRFWTPFLKQTTRLIVCPDRSHLPFEGNRRAAGIAISLYGLRSKRNWGCGDFADLCDFARWSRQQLGADFVALNPLHAISNRQPYNISPYLPECTLYRNPLYLDVEQVPEFAASAAAQRWLKESATQEEITALRDSDLVSYERVAKLKRRALAYAFRQLLRDYKSGGARAKQFREYVAREGEPLARYAAFQAIGEYLRKFAHDLWLWTDWPDDYADPASETVRRFCAQHRIRVLFHQYVQWLVDQQLEAVQKYTKSVGMTIGLYHDLALATDRFGADLWGYGSTYATGCRVGSPPDDFAPEGQDWSFPPPNSTVIRAQGYSRFIDTVRKTARHGGALRLDHVMRLFRLYWIPEGYTAAGGTYVRDNARDMLRILALESIRNRIVIIGEDLGTVSDEMRAGLTSHGILSYRLFFFERHYGGPFKQPGEYPTQAVVATTTHDLPTLAGFWSARDIHVRRVTGRLPDEEMYKQQLRDRQRDKVLMLESLAASGLLGPVQADAAAGTEHLPAVVRDAILSFLASTPAHLFILNQEDLTMVTDQQNVPGTTHEYPNWQRKMAWTIEELSEGERPKTVANQVRTILDLAGRIHR